MGCCRWWAHCLKSTEYIVEKAAVPVTSSLYDRYLVSSVLKYCRVAVMARPLRVQTQGLPPFEREIVNPSLSLPSLSLVSRFFDLFDLFDLFHLLHLFDYLFLDFSERVHLCRLYCCWPYRLYTLSFQVNSWSFQQNGCYKCSWSDRWGLQLGGLHVKVVLQVCQTFPEYHCRFPPGTNHARVDGQLLPASLSTACY